MSSTPVSPLADTALERTVADDYLRRLAEHGTRWIFCNAGTDFPPLIEAYERAAQRRETLPLPLLIPHENVAMGMAYGAALTTGQAQVVMVHVGVGTANALCGLMNAAKQQIPLLLAAGRTPILEGGKLGARNNYINWAQELFDQGGMVRELVKWDYELRDPAQVGAVVDRAFAAIQSSPPGPAYLVLPREVLSAPAAKTDSRPPQSAPYKTPRAQPEDLDQAADWLAAAERPVIVTSDIGRSSEAFHALDAFARRWSIPVVQYRPRHANLPTAHPMFVGFDPAQWAPSSDCILVLDSDVPWIPDECPLAADARVIQVGLDPLYLDYPMRSFASDLSIAADSGRFLNELDQALAARAAPGQAARRDARAQRIAERTAPLRTEQDVPVGLNHRYVSRCLARFFNDRTTVVNEYTFTLEELSIDRPASFYSHSPAGGLGWGTGMALGIKLAAPEKRVVLCVGDGSYLFGNPSSAHFVARALDLPTLTVIFNNRRWAAVHRATLSMYPDGLAARDAEPPLTCLEPSPDYERIVEASGGLGLRVERVEELQDTLQRAFEAVDGGRQVVINILTEASYIRSS